MRTLVCLLGILGGLLLFGNTTYRRADAAAVQLGRRLFMDSILSEDYSLSCASCHRPEFAFADTSAVSVGVHGRRGVRNTPTAMNVTERLALFWDGRAATLEEQALMPIANPVEMNLPVDSAVARLQRHAEYPDLFMQAFGEAPSAATLGQALAAFQRSLETSSPYDRFMMGDSGAISESAKRGLLVFNEKGLCVECHFSGDLTGDEFRNIGLFDGQRFYDTGRFAITQDSADLGKFKTPSLRNVAITAPYMHDGSFRTLREVIDYYDRPDDIAPLHINRDTLLRKPLQLTEQEKQDLEAFLRTLTASQFLK